MQHIDLVDIKIDSSSQSDKSFCKNIIENQRVIIYNPLFSSLTKHWRSVDSSLIPIHRFDKSLTEYEHQRRLQFVLVTLCRDIPV